MINFVARAGMLVDFASPEYKQARLDRQAVLDAHRHKELLQAWQRDRQPDAGVVQ
jgi:hypothetical protein